MKCASAFDLFFVPPVLVDIEIRTSYRRNLIEKYSIVFEMTRSRYIYPLFSSLSP